MTETPENTAHDVQAPTTDRLPEVATVKRCLATTRSGQPCKAHPLVSSDFCSLHSGLASEWGRRGGLNRRRNPKPAPRKPAAQVAPDSPVASLPDVTLDTVEDVQRLLVETANALRHGEIDAQVSAQFIRLAHEALVVVQKTNLDRRIRALEADKAPK